MGLIEPALWYIDTPVLDGCPSAAVPFVVEVTGRTGRPGTEEESCI
jgi:hypothetical protein